MPLRNYGVLAGRVVESRAEQGAASPHFEIRVQAGVSEFRAAVNVLSRQAPSELLYLADEDFQHPILSALPRLPDGFTPVLSSPGGFALDFIRGNLFDRSAMRALPPSSPGPDNDLAEKLEHFVDRARVERDARLYVFGERWGPDAAPDEVFKFVPGNGVHDVHMNQGNSETFAEDDGVWQDGGLLLNFPSRLQWVGIFLAFQSQAWHTNDQTGHALVTPEEPDHGPRIVASLVNPVGPAPEQESVTLINPRTTDINLAGWTLLDRLKHRMDLDPATLPAGEAVRLALRPPIQLGNGGGLITLLNPAGLKVDGVSYTARAGPNRGHHPHLLAVRRLPRGPGPAGSWERPRLSGVRLSGGPASQDVRESLDGDRFGEVVVHPCGQGSISILGHGTGRHRDDGNARRSSLRVVGSPSWLRTRPSPAYGSPSAPPHRHRGTTPPKPRRRSRRCRLDSRAEPGRVRRPAD